MTRSTAHHAASGARARCGDCGARYATAEHSCEARFQALLALDHSRRPPWGPLHGLAFASYALQHPSQYNDDVLGRSWTMLCLIVVHGEDPADAADRIRRAHGSHREWGTPSFPGRAALAPSFGVTITSLGDFPADRYAAEATEWAAATLRGYGLTTATAAVAKAAR